MPETKHRISIHLAADAPFIVDSDFLELTEEQLRLVMLEADAYALGNQTRVLVRVGGFSLIHTWFKANYPLPRHSHAHDCLYYVITGSLQLGKRTLRPGDSFLVTADTPYQYVAGAEGVEVLEIRHGVAHTDMTVYDSEARIAKRAGDALAANRDAWAEAEVSPTFAATAGRS